ncbi:propionate kinase [Vibrio panuliri]|uniref:Acetate kinase n=1 Tax=Vibrio panuliri TaxID=1381081 RepID=A0ABX3FM53_9VIBR|nr:propionate kinase [Vibrio panuliri]KAB1454065.1 propionate kinase [Vibrio panuliri]OLQ95299.1 propionate/acetate kinase [Vibrio panuliri]
MIVLVINCGSSSVKFSVIDAQSSEELLTGIVDGLNSDNAWISVNGESKTVLTQQGYEGAFIAIALELEQRELAHRIAAIGHRVAHGGNLFKDSVLITDRVIEEIRSVSDLAPLHNKANLMGIEMTQKLFPSAQQVAAFDTSFHQTLAPEAYLYALPWEYYEKHHVRRYGFHGSSHRYVSNQAYGLLKTPKQNSGIVIAHLGNGSSICAVKNGKSVDTSMGMTPLEGLMMGTRCGDVDFGAMVWIAKQTNQSLDDLERIVNKESGLLGLSGISSDLRDLEKEWHQGNERAIVTIKTFVHRIARQIAGHAASLSRLDGIIFTGGIGENSSLIRRLVLEHLQVFNIELHQEKNDLSNRFGERIITTENSRVTCAVIPTNEEKMIALDAIRLSDISLSTLNV